MKVYKNKENGHIFPYTMNGKREMLYEAVKLYNIHNIATTCEWCKYYDIVNI